MINVFFLKNHGNYVEGEQGFIERAEASGLILDGTCEVFTTRLDRMAQEAQEAQDKKEKAEKALKLKPKPQRKKRQIKKAVSKVAETRTKAIVE